MPNVHSAFKRLFSVQLTQEVYRKLEKRAEAFDMPINTYIATVLARDLANVKLTKEDEAIILARINEVIAKRAAR